MSPLDPALTGLYTELGLALPGPAALETLAGVAPGSPAARRRQELARVLGPAHREDPAARQALEQLAQPDTPVLVTGQQAGLLLGPGYTLHKTLALLALRDRVTRATGRPAVAVFWAETNDHDWDEATLVRIPGRPDFRLPRPAGSEGHSLGRIPFDAAHKAPLRTLLAELAAQWPAALVESTRQALDACVTPGDFFCLLLQRLSAGSGLLVLDPSRPALRELAAPFFRELHALGEEPARTVERNTAVLASHGLAGPVEQASPWPWFVEVDGRRQRPADALQARASVSGPADRLSPDVVSRPLLQDWLLGSALSLLGPGELRYNCQLAGLHASLGLREPLLWPRPQLRWIAASERAELLALGLDPAAPPVPGQPWPEHWLAGLEGMDEALERSRELAAMAERIRGLAGPDGESRPDLLAAADKACAALAHLDERLQHAARRRHKGRLREIHRITDWLDHPGLPQERRVNSLALLGRAGCSAITENLWSAVDPLAGGTAWLVHDTTGTLVTPPTPNRETPA